MVRAILKWTARISGTFTSLKKEYSVDGKGTKINGICIFCADPTPGIDQWRRIKKHLISPERRLTGLGFLGAPMSLAHAEELPFEYGLLIVRQIPFHLKKFKGAEEIVIVGHDCGYYEELMSGRDFTVAEKEQDIINAVALVKKRFGLPTSGFFANGGADDFKQLA